MSVTATTNSMCNQLVQKYWDLVAPVHKIKNQVKSELNKFERMLSGMVFSVSNDIDNALHNLENEAKGIIPGSTIDDLREIQRFLNGCDFFEGTNPVAAVLGGSLAIYDQLDDYFQTIPLPEFQAGAVANTLKKLMSGVGIGLPNSNNIENILRNADKLLACLNAFCPGKASEAQLIASDLQGLYDILKVVDDPNNPNYGQINFDSIYEDVGMTAMEILNMNNVINGMWETQAEASVGLGNAVNSIKTAIKGGFF